MQLRDQFGNAVEALDVSVTISLAWPAGCSSDNGLPKLELAERKTQQSDAQGKVFFGDVYIAEGSGKVEAGAEPSMELDLLFSAVSLSG